MFTIDQNLHSIHGSTSLANPLHRRFKINATLTDPFPMREASVLFTTAWRPSNTTVCFSQKKREERKDAGTRIHFTTNSARFHINVDLSRCDRPLCSESRGSIMQRLNGTSGMTKTACQRLYDSEMTLIYCVRSKMTSNYQQVAFSSP